MFSGIIEEKGEVVNIVPEDKNVHLTIRSKLSSSSYIDQSIAHNGVCLTVVKITDDTHTVTAIQETMRKTNLSKLVIGSPINLERCITPETRMDGHFVQGHVDGKGIIKSIEEEGGSWKFTIEFDAEFAPLLVSKGSVCIDGISLTVIDPTKDTFSVAIIPYTYEFTNLSNKKLGDRVNLEFDIFGKYVQRYLSLKDS